MLAPAFVAALFLVPAALAVPYVTAPVASTSWAAGTAQTITYTDDGTAPNLAAFSNASVGLYVGSVNTQIMVQQISASVNLSTTAAITWTPEATVGQNSDEYFIRFVSLTAKNGSNPVEAFSAKFTLTGMTGTFNSSELADIGTTSGSSSTPAATPQTPASSSSSSSSSGASPSGSAASNAANGAMILAVGPLASLTGAAAILLGAMLF